MNAGSVKGSTHGGALRPSRWWHLARTVLGYGLLGAEAVGVILAAPFLALTSSSREERELRVQRLIHRAWRLYLWGLEKLRIARVRLPADVERLQEPGVLVVANHPSRLDVAALLAAMPQADLIVKRDYYDNPLLGLASRAAGYQPTRGGPVDLVTACAEKLVRGRSLIVFPEGTRSPAGGLGCFQRGAAHIALLAGRDPIPVTITCDPPSLHRDQRWWEAEAFEVTLRIGDSPSVKELTSEAKTRGQAVRIVTAALREHFERGVLGAEA